MLLTGVWQCKTCSPQPVSVAFLSEEKSNNQLLADGDGSGSNTHLAISFVS